MMGLLHHDCRGMHDQSRARRGVQAPWWGDVCGRVSSTEGATPLVWVTSERRLGLGVVGTPATLDGGRGVEGILLGVVGRVVQLGCVCVCVCVCTCVYV